MHPAIIAAFSKLKKPPMKIGDKVRKITGYRFFGTVVAIGTKSDGKEFAVVEIEPNTNAEGLLYIHILSSLEVIPDGTPTVTGVMSDVLEPVPPPPKPDFPVSMFIPLKALPANASKVNQFKSQVRLNFLPYKPHQSLITESVTAEVEFHFTGTPVGDLDNLLKPVLDLLKGSVLWDDAQIKGLSAKFVTPSEQMGFRVRLTKHED